jgi:hydroxymethylbilane synthase
MRMNIGTRGSSLAMAQAETVRLQIAKLMPGEDIRLENIKTQGDRLSLEEGLPAKDESPQGIFTRELDEALLSGRIRAAVHSLKDVPTTLPAGIRYGAFIKREDPRDALISRTGKDFFELPAQSKVGTSSPRRGAQIRVARTDLKVVPLRGNVDTRLSKLASGEVDAIVIAAAGLIRLGREGEITEVLPPEVMLPAPAQGILCVTIREDDKDLAGALKSLDDLKTRVCAEAERAFLKTLQGGCRVPVGALAALEGNTLILSGIIADISGDKIMRNSAEGSAKKPKELGDELARMFLENGAAEILRKFGKIAP